MPEVHAETSHLLELPPELLQLVPRWSKSNVLKFLGIEIPTSSSAIYDALLSDQTAHPYGEDIQAGLNVADQWHNRLPLNPGDSRTFLIISRMLVYAETEKFGDQGREIVLSEMQKKRNVEDNPDILNWRLTDMMSLSGGTTQWAGAAILLQGRNDELDELMTTVRPDQQFMLQKAVDIRSRWMTARILGKKVTLDERDYETTILRQARHYYTSLVTGVQTPFIPEHSEDVFMSIFTGAITPNDALELYPQIEHHESKRNQESEEIMASNEIDTGDHRGAQAGILCFPEKTWTTRTEKAVRKTWPQFFQFRILAQELAAKS